MRKLVILRGAMGAGKSQFVRDNGLEMYTLSSDTIRLMFNAPEQTIEYSSMIPQFNNKKVWSLLYYLLEERMKKGEFTIVDAVHASKDDLQEYKSLAEKYRYRLFLVDFTDISKEELYARNEAREEYKIVPKESIDRIYKKLVREEVPKSFKVVKPDGYNSILTTNPIDFNRYEKVHVIGDIHGCFSVLKTYFDENPFEESSLYVFLGDYFDRGLENSKTFEFLKTIMEMENTIFLMGNHEDKLYKYACDDEYKVDYGIKKTIEEFEESGIKKSEIRGFVKKLAQISYMTFGGKTFIISHGGIPYFPKVSLDYLSSNSFIYGIDKYEVNIDEIYDSHMTNREDKVYQIHGHRNFLNIDPCKYEFSFNLDGDVENGGDLRILSLYRDGSCDYKLCNNEVFDGNLKEKSGVFDLVDALRNSKYVYEKDLGDSISSFNFTREAFYNRRWNDLTTKARGLFIDVEKYNIIARSYDKFFQIGERNETKYETLKDSVKYPISCFLKYNGFLGILSQVNGELFFASKSTNVGDYVEYFKNIFYAVFDDEQIDGIRKVLDEENVSFVFEVMDPVDDPHIIEYDNPKIVLLDVIKNSLSFEKLSFEELSRLGEKHGIEVKKLSYLLEDEGALDEFYSQIKREDYVFDGEHVEGFVLEDQNNFMVKCKTEYYKKWKYLRAVMEDAVGKNDFSINSKDDMTVNFVKYLKEKYENSEVDVKSVDIISERKEFFKNYGQE